MLAIAGGKGGCGKTTSAVGLARALAATGTAPVVVDADPDMPSVPRTAGIEPVADVGTIVDGILPRAVRDGRSDVAIVGCRDAAPADVAPVLRRLRRLNRPVLVDCPAGAGPDAARPLRVADATVVVSTRTQQSLTDAIKTVAMARELDGTVLGSVLTMCRRPAERDASPAAALDCPVLARVPRVRGDPLADPTVRMAYRTLAAELNGRNV